MKYFLSLSLLIFLSFPVMAKEQPPVRGFIWGLPKEIIKEYESGRFVAEESNVIDGDTHEVVFFRDKIRDLYTNIGYEFLNGKLWRVQIFVENRYNEQQNLIRDLLTVQTDLNSRFGEPTAQDMKWFNKRNYDYPDAWGWSVFRKELIMTSLWQEGETDVTTYLGAKEKYNPELIVTYVHRPTKIEIDQKEQQDLFLLP
jgi:hypothetical protein